MPRWEPDAAGRLAAAALELFEADGYESTSVVAIAARAGLAKSTFFRHFEDKREVLFSGEPIIGVLGRRTLDAPPGASPLSAVVTGLEALGREFFTEESRSRHARRERVILASPELCERDALKRADLLSTMVRALESRGVPPLDAAVAARIGMLVWDLAYGRWLGGDEGGEGFVGEVRRALDEVRATIARIEDEE